MNIREIIAYIVIGILLFGAGFLGYKVVSGNRQLSAVTAQLSAVRNAPVKIDTVHDSIVLPGGVVIKPIPVRVVVHDTIIKQIRENWYDSTYATGGIRFRYRARIMGELRELTFNDFVFPKEIITIRKPFDTCIEKPVPRQPFLRWGPYVGMTLNSFNKFPGMEIGAQVVIKDQVTISAGGLALDGIYGNIRVGWLFKK